jgi:hypothetical protein
MKVSNKNRKKVKVFTPIVIDDITNIHIDYHIQDAFVSSEWNPKSETLNILEQKVYTIRKPKTFIEKLIFCFTS